ncbi:hypothetical protein H4R20_000274 [Coemansia guatemalensis]|uniref:Uncharacterized protein n=1 Tax=Coemansia guatemalensis TaxID=2761395 RepID=A0A9W8LX25_9FUNG|nr:hypothetical protein H4R20_000274 [Coemansia guatemalensis]
MAERQRAEQRRLEAFTRISVFEYRGVDAPPRSPQVLSRQEYVLGMEPLNTEDVRARNSSEILARLVREHAAILTASKDNMLSSTKSSLACRDTQRMMLEALQDAEKVPKEKSQNELARAFAAPAAFAAATVLALLGGGSGMYLYLA